MPLRNSGEITIMNNADADTQPHQELNNSV